MGCDVSTLVKKAATKGNSPELIDKKILLLGLENAGKTSILMSFKQKEFVDTVPTVGLNIEQVNFMGYAMTMWDVGGQATKLWKHYFDHIDAIVFVVDWTSDDKRMAKAQVELHRVATDKALERVPILLMLNKDDLRES